MQKDFIQQAIETSNKLLMQYWPLRSFIATNPLWEKRDQPFFEVISQPRIQSLMPVTYYVQQYLAGNIAQAQLLQSIQRISGETLQETDLKTWIANSLKSHDEEPGFTLFAEQVEEYRFQKTTVWIKEKLFKLFRDYFGLEQYQRMTLRDYWQANRGFDLAVITALDALPLDEAIASLVNELKIPEQLLTQYFETIYLQIYGWAGLMNWRNHHEDNPWLPGKDDCALILFFWLSYEVLVANKLDACYQAETTKVTNKEALQKRYIWQTAFELSYIEQLTQQLIAPANPQEQAIDAQFVFCIDTRSEGFRRHLEAEGGVETFGFAGFFGAVFSLKDGDNISYQAPALVAAEKEAVVEKCCSKKDNIDSDLKTAAQHSKKQLSAPFVLFEMLGVWFLPFMLFKNLQNLFGFKKKSRLGAIKHNFSLQEQVDTAANLLRGIGLVKGFAEKVLLCAHRSDHLNNPFNSSLDCGACGGNSGVPNALIMTEILNTPAVRLELKAQGIEIPASTQFVAACHHTVDDRLEILSGEIDNSLNELINRAAKNLRQEKRTSLPGNAALKARERNWSELIPELGLINNAAIIIAPRSLTLGKNLGRRTFLHSYEPKLDPEGAILTSILSAPAIVAHWISSQYYFSTVRPEIFGAGNKAIHNVLPGVGVLEGNFSDLKVGLPLQSTHFQSQAIHQPRRITVVVQADKAVLNMAIANSPDFKMLLDNEWIYLKHIPVVEKRVGS